MTSCGVLLLLICAAVFKRKRFSQHPSFTRAYLRLAHQDDLEFQNRAQFFGLAAQVMRTILVDHARSKTAAKRGGGGSAITLRDDMAVSQQSSTDVLVLHDALEALSVQDQRKGSVVEMRYFGGMTATGNTSEALDISRSTVGWNHVWRGNGLRRMRAVSYRYMAAAPDAPVKAYSLLAALRPRTKWTSRLIAATISRRWIAPPAT